MCYISLSFASYFVIFLDNYTQKKNPTVTARRSVRTYTVARKEYKQDSKSTDNDKIFASADLRIVMDSVMAAILKEIDKLSSLSKFHSDYRQASIISLTETWLKENRPSTYYDLDCFSLYRCDRDINSDKTCGGGVCTYINNKWCHRNNIHQVKKEASKDVELLRLSLRPFYLPREFTNVYVTTIYTPPDSNVENAKNIINKHVNDLMTKSPDCINILTGDFNNSLDISLTFQDLFNT